MRLLMVGFVMKPSLKKELTIENEKITVLKKSSANLNESKAQIRQSHEVLS